MPKSASSEHASSRDTDAAGNPWPGVSGNQKNKKKDGRPGWRWYQLARELHRLYLLSCDPALSIVLPPTITGAAKHISEWMAAEWAAGRGPPGMKTMKVGYRFDQDHIRARISRRHKATSTRDHERFMGGADAYKQYHTRMLQDRERARIAAEKTLRAA